MERFEVGGAEIEYEVRGEGEPVLLIHVGLVADGLAWPLFKQPELAAGYRLIHYHRRGYMGSTLGPGPLTMALQAGDAAALLRRLGVSSAHVAGHSIGAAIALQLATDAPELVHSLALLEPSLSGDPSRNAAIQRMLAPMLTAYRLGDKRQAVELFCDAVFGPKWQAVIEQAIPGSAGRAVKDVDAFVLELTGMRAWPFGLKEAEAIRQPVLSVLGARSSTFMKEGRTLLHSWFPQAEDCDVPTTHLLQLQDPQGVAQGLARFFARHPLSSKELRPSWQSARRS